MSRFKAHRGPEAGRFLTPEPARSFDDEFDRGKSPSVMRNVLQPLEKKMDEYDVLMTKADEERTLLDEEIRLLQEARFRAEKRYMAAQVKYDKYDRQHRGVNMALRGELPPEPIREPNPEPEFEKEMAVVRMNSVDSIDSEIQIHHEPKTPAHRSHLPPSDKFTMRQLFYLLVMDGFGGMIISGGINFGLAYAMYTTQNTVKNPILLFQLPNTLAGDGAVTVIIQCIITWFVEKALVAHDLSRRTVQPIGFIAKPNNPCQRWFFFLPSLGYKRAAGEDSKYEPEAKAPSGGFGSIISGFAQNALRGFLFAIVSFFLVWPAAIAILIAVGQHADGDYTYDAKWIPEIYKGILGGVLGLLTTPLMAMFWLIKAGWEADQQWAIKS